jgi:hypothetical protein
MCHSPRPSVLLARYYITTFQPTRHTVLGDPDPTDLGSFSNDQAPAYARQYTAWDVNRLLAETQ